MMHLEKNIKHLSNSDDLITTHEAIRAGFLQMILEKNRLAEPFVAEARTLKVKASKATVPGDLSQIPGIRAALITAAGASDKSQFHLNNDDLNMIIDEFITKVLEPAGDKFIEELVYRFLLIRGDSMGGKIRNLISSWSQRRFLDFIIADFKVEGKTFKWFDSKQKKWFSNIEDEDYKKVRGLNWQVDNNDRVMLFNLNIPFIQNEEENGKKKGGKNVDICVFNCNINDLSTSKKKKEIIENPNSYIAAGELKGGFDPAGADEHWKTANSAIKRIKDSFKRYDCFPKTVFIAGAITTSMADEIWGLLKENSLDNAANLTSDPQMVSVISWLCNI